MGMRLSVVTMVSACPILFLHSYVLVHSTLHISSRTLMNPRLALLFTADSHAMRGWPVFLSAVASALSPPDLWSGPPEQAYYLHNALIRNMSLGLLLVKTRK